MTNVRSEYRKAWSGWWHDGQSLARQLANAREHAYGIAVVKRARGLVHDDGLRFLGDGARDEHELLLAARDLRVGAVSQLFDANALEGVISARCDACRECAAYQGRCRCS